MTWGRSPILFALTHNCAPAPCCSFAQHGGGAQLVEKYGALSPCFSVLRPTNSREANVSDRPLHLFVLHHFEVIAVADMPKFCLLCQVVKPINPSPTNSMA